ncbi:MAG: DUF1667 domain-containing protein [Oscillospiraceae bacterium]|jgi:CxxC motif-containing protein
MEMICINCPKGCRLRAEKTADGWEISGYSCPRGKEYAYSEVTDPRRTLTSTVVVKSGAIRRCPMKSASPIPKDLVKEAAKALDGVVLEAPVRIGDIVVKDILGTGCDIVATRNIDRI